MSEKALVDYSVRDDVAYLVLDAPPLNILTAAMMNEITGCIENARSDRSLKAVAIYSRGKAFSAGADVGEHRPEQAAEMIAAFSRMFECFGALDLPVVMGVHGTALGAGFELAMMADVLVATESATLGQPEIRLGFFAPVGVAWLPKLVGVQKAIEITCSGRAYSASDMERWGLVSGVVADGDLEAGIEAKLKDFRCASPLVLRMNVRLVRQLAGVPFEQARREAEKVFLEELMATEDVREGIASFFEKRRPQWKNC